MQHNATHGGIVLGLLLVNRKKYKYKFIKWPPALDFYNCYAWLISRESGVVQTILCIASETFFGFSSTPISASRYDVSFTSPNQQSKPYK